MSARRERDRTARRAAQTRFDAPLVLEAGAGTGKTASLVARVLGWSLGPGWERAVAQRGEATARERIAAHVFSRVAAITFTEAAAAEMGQRVGEALEQLVAGEVPIGVDADALPETPEERGLRAAALRAVLDQLRVQTIHAFCRRLLAEHPLEAGLHPGFGVDADESGQQAAVRQVIEAALPGLFAESAAMLELARAGVSPSHIEDALLFLLRGGVAPEALAEDPLGAVPCAELVVRLRAPLAAFLALEAGRLAALASRARAAAGAAEALERLAETLAEGDVALETLLDAVAEVAPGPVQKWARGEFGKRGEEALGGDVALLAERAAALLPVLEHVQRVDPTRLRALREVLLPLHASVLEALRARGVETFSALLADARRLLREAPEVRRRLQGDLDQLLVDEFQDTDPVQCDIVRAIALDPDADSRPGLFLVGDPKQSIYGWRSADLAAYEQFVDEVCAAGGVREPLVVNHRSTPAILDEVSRLFAPTLVAEPGVQPHFEALLPAEGAVDVEFGDERAAVEYWVSWRWDAERGEPVETLAAEGDALEARAVAADIAELGRGGTRWRDIGLLFRAGTGVEPYLAALREAGVPFAVEGDRSYFERREVVDAGALVRSVLDPNDHLALLTLLRSSVVGAPDAALLPLWAHGLPLHAGRLQGSDARALEAFERAIDAARAEVPSDVPGIEGVEGWHENLRAAGHMLASLRAAFEDDPADVFVEKLRALSLYEVTEASRYLGAYRLANLDRFFRQLLSALCDAEGDPQAVLRALRSQVAERPDAEEGRPREAIEDAVQVMTIHKAKGLDFEHVYVLQLNRGRGHGRQPRAELCEGRLELDLLGLPSLGYDRVEERRRAVERAEQVRTLYVAATRARRRLVLAGVHPEFAARASGGSFLELIDRREGGRPDLASEARRRDGPAAGSFFDAADARWVFPALRPEPVRARRAARPAALDPAAVGEAAATLERRRARADADAARPFRSVASAQGHTDAPAQAGEDAPAVAAAAGTLVHHVLETLDLAIDPAAALAAAREGLADRPLAEAVGPERDAVLARADAILAGMAQGRPLERLAEVAAHVVARELDVSLPAGESGAVACTSGAIDLVYQDPADGRLAVVDYKTDRVSGAAELAARAERYAPQGAVYVAALRDALGLDYTPRFELWFLDAGEIVSA